MAVRGPALMNWVLSTNALARQPAVLVTSNKSSKDEIALEHASTACLGG
jgi:hypothetical protein